MTALSFKEIPFDSPEFSQECQLRDTVLRQPLGLSLYDEKLETERNQIHFGLINDNSELIACVIADPQSHTTIKLRQMAVSPSYQGQGHGSNLLKLAEAQLLKKGFKDILLHARSTAIPFYKKVGYEQCDTTFIEVGIPHIVMQKQL